MCGCVRGSLESLSSPLTALGLGTVWPVLDVSTAELKQFSGLALLRHLLPKQFALEATKLLWGHQGQVLPQRGANRLSFTM